MISLKNSKNIKMRPSAAVQLLIIALITLSCSTSESTISDTKPYEIRPTLGDLKMNINYLRLHKGEVSQLSVLQFNKFGNPEANSAITWSTSDPTVASVSSGQVTAIGLGDCEIYASDGIHQRVSSQISVLQISAVISNAASQVTWNIPNNVFFTNVNSEKLLEYTLYNDQGNLASGVLTINPPVGSGLTLTGNLLNATNSGYFSVPVFVDGNPLGILQVVVLEPSTNSNSTDTIYRYTLKPNTFPFRFFKPTTATQPVVLNGYKVFYDWEHANGATSLLPSYIYFTTSPSSFEFSNDKIGLSDGGLLKGFQPSNGSSTITKVNFPNGEWVKCDSWVFPDISGNWTGALDNKTFNYCLVQQGPHIQYYANILECSNQLCVPGNISTGSFGYKDVLGYYDIREDGEPVYYGVGNSIKGIYDGYSGTTLTYPNGSNTDLAWTNDSHLQLQKFNRIGSLWYAAEIYTRGGSCSQEEPEILTLQEVLQNHTWNTNACLQNIAQYTSTFTFNQDGSWSAPQYINNDDPWISGEHPISWWIIEESGSKVIMVSALKRDDGTVNSDLVTIEDAIGAVESFTENQVNFHGEELGCSPQIDRQ